MKVTVTMRQTFSDVSALRRAMKALTEQDVLIGIPEDKGVRKEGEGLNNATLGYIHEFGTADGHIPARPHLIPGIRKALPDMVDALRRGAEGALQGNDGAVRTALDKVGVLGQNAVRAVFADNDWPPLAESTLNAKALKKDDSGNVMTDRKGNPQREKSRAEQGRTNPLIDTGQLRKAYTYVIRKKGQGTEAEKLMEVKP